MSCLQGTFFLLEKLKLTVLRRLLMRCCILHLTSCPPGTPNPHHFPLGMLTPVLLNTSGIVRHLFVFHLSYLEVVHEALCVAMTLQSVKATG